MRKLVCSKLSVRLGSVCSPGCKRGAVSLENVFREVSVISAGNRPTQTKPKPTTMFDVICTYAYAYACKPNVRRKEQQHQLMLTLLFLVGHLKMLELRCATTRRGEERRRGKATSRTLSVSPASSIIAVGLDHSSSWPPAWLPRAEK